ncbi:MAG: peptide chain release factor 1 [Bdellovibrionales bacterium]|nr:peptide chain release factor 1 [Bdellovibrionales bacterium]
MSINSKLEQIEKKFEEISDKLTKSEIIAQRDTYNKLSKEYAALKPIVETFRHLTSVEKQIEDNYELSRADDDEIAELAKEELEVLYPEQEKLQGELKILLLPKDPMDEKNVMLEIRAGTGGDEAGLFVADLLRMYLRYAEKMRWKTEIMSQSDSAGGGLREVIVMLEGQDVYSHLKFEGGVHRVQRVPETETQGRVHTSACTVVVMPEADEVDVKIEEKDLRIDVMRSSGPGGQSVNTTDSAVRITHIPTNTVVVCQDEKSQHKNKAKALKVLRSRLLEMEQAKQLAEISATRKSMVGSGDRSERIRTYNFPQNRLTDHRINLTLHKLDYVMEGDLDEVITELRTYHQAELLKADEKNG